jgi:phage-related protein
MDISTILTALLAIIEDIAPTAAAGTIGKIIAALVNLLPLIIKEIQALVPIVQNIITALRGNGQITPEQLDALDAMEAQIDADYDAAEKAAEAEDNAPPKS